MRGVREDEFAAAVQTGRDNAEMIDLIRHHCSHARVVMPSGNSTVGEAYGLPMGSLEIRREHAPPPYVDSDLADGATARAGGARHELHRSQGRHHPAITLPGPCLGPRQPGADPGWVTGRRRQRAGTEQAR